jgi:glucose-6-phosphate-specific signal transduction histidine kinase
MAFGRAFPGATVDPLFARFFWIATVFNFIPAVLAGAVLYEWAGIGLAHVLFIIRVVIAEQHAAHQRATDLDHFLKLKTDQANARVQS